MGTTEDKLNKLKATKEAIRTAINNKGGTLTETDTFASYATAIENIQTGGGNSLKSLLDRTKSAECLFAGKAYTSTYSSTNNQFFYMNSSELNEIISYEDTSACTNMGYMFQNCNNLTTIPLIDTSSCTNMSYMFCDCSNLQTIPQLDTSKVTNMYEMFFNCSNLQTIPQLNTSVCTKMGHMFRFCSNLQTIPQLDTNSCTRLEYMFGGCSNLQSIDLTHIKATSISSIEFFAENCYSLTKLIIRNMDTIPTLSSNSFKNCYHFYGTTDSTYNPEGLKDGRIYVPDNKVEELKTTTNWSVFADIIVPLSTLVEE